MKKAAINDVAKKLGCNKVAFAHHRDDALETLFMNMIHGGAVATFEPKMRLDRAGIDFIRPFIFASEEQLTALTREENIPVMGKTCPADGYTERQYCKEWLRKLYEERPEAVTNFSSMLYETHAFRLYFDHLEYPCPENGELTIKPIFLAEEAISYLAYATEKGLSPLGPKAEHFLLCKNHKPLGAISYRFRSPHEVEVLGYDYDGLNPEEAELLYHHFEKTMWKRINPLTFLYLGKPERCPSSYQAGIPPYGSVPSKRFNR